MYALRYLPGAQRFFKKLKEKGLPWELAKAFDEIYRNSYKDFQNSKQKSIKTS